MIILNVNFVRSGWWNLNLPGERRFSFVALVLSRRRASSWEVGVAFGSILDLVQAFFLPVESFDLNHVECIC